MEPLLDFSELNILRSYLAAKTDAPMNLSQKFVWILSRQSKQLAGGGVRALCDVTQHRFPGVFERPLSAANWSKL